MTVGRPGRGGGFTLLEVVVALAITGLVVGAVYAALDAVIDAHERNRTVQEDARRDRNARAVLASLLRSARADSALGQPAFRGIDAPGGDALEFDGTLGFSLAGRPSGERVRVRIASGPGGLALILTGAGNPGRSDSLLLLSDVRAIEARYLDPATGEWTRSWERPDALPGAVALAFVAGSPPPALLVEVPARQRNFAADGAPPESGSRVQ